MHPLHANIDLAHYTEPALSIALDKIFNSLTDNASDFSALPIALGTYQTRKNNYQTILGKPIYPSKTGDLQAALDLVLSTVRDNGVYVNQVAKGVLSLLEKSGYPISKPHAPVGPLGKTVTEASSIAGGFDVVISQFVAAHTNGFLVLYCPSAQPAPAKFSDWQHKYFPKHTGRIDGLDASTKYRLVSVALGTDPQLTYSDAIERTTQ